MSQSKLSLPVRWFLIFKEPEELLEEVVVAPEQRFQRVLQLGRAAPTPALPPPKLLDDALQLVRLLLEAYLLGGGRVTMDTCYQGNMQGHQELWFNTSLQCQCFTH